MVRPALLWNDTRSAGAAADLIAELAAARPAGWADAVGLVPVASFTVTKLRWLAEHEPDNAARTAAVCLPHDWLTWRLARRTGLDALRTDRGDASGTGYWSAATGQYRPDLLRRAFGRDADACRRCSGRPASPGSSPPARRSGPGAGDNAAAALGVGAAAGRRDRVDRHLRHGVQRRRQAGRRRVRGGGRVRRRDRPVPAAGRHAQRRPGAGRRRRHARRRPRRAGRAGAVRRRPAPTGSSWCPTWRASAPRTVRWRPVRCTG